MGDTPPPLSLITFTLRSTIKPHPYDVNWSYMPTCVELLAEAEIIRQWAVDQAFDLVKARDYMPLSKTEGSALTKICNTAEVQRKIYMTISILLRKCVRSSLCHFFIC
jgi:hypothetical protein